MTLEKAVEREEHGKKLMNFDSAVLSVSLCTPC